MPTTTKAASKTKKSGGGCREFHVLKNSLCLFKAIVSTSESMDFRYRRRRINQIIRQTTSSRLAGVSLARLGKLGKVREDQYR
jgi:hypothetical protein